MLRQIPFRKVQTLRQTAKIRPRIKFHLFLPGYSGDLPVPEDYDGDGSDDIAVFRPSSALWIVRGLSRFYFGKSGDVPVPGIYQWAVSSRASPAVFRGADKLWIIRDLTRFYFGAEGDTPLRGYLENAVTEQPAFSRPDSKIWAIVRSYMLRHALDTDWEYGKSKFREKVASKILALNQEIKAERSAKGKKPRKVFRGRGKA